MAKKVNKLKLDQLKEIKKKLEEAKQTASQYYKHITDRIKAIS